MLGRRDDPLGATTRGSKLSKRLAPDTHFDRSTNRRFSGLKTFRRTQCSTTRLGGSRSEFERENPQLKAIIDRGRAVPPSTHVTHLTGKGFCYIVSEPKRVITSHIQVGSKPLVSRNHGRFGTRRPGKGVHALRMWTSDCRSTTSNLHLNVNDL